MGLWALAGSWSSNQLTDGWVPDYIAARLDTDYREHAAALVRAGLWVEDEQGGDKGWRFHQWGEHQPSAESVLVKREAARERMRRVREHRNAGSQDVRANVHENFAGSAPNPDPTRPDLKEPSSSNGLFEEPPKPSTPKPGSDDDPNWARFWAAYPKKTSKKTARLRWASAIKQKHDPEEIILGAQRYAERVKRERIEYRYVKHPDGWLNGELWRDEAPPPGLYPPMNAPYRGQPGVAESNAPRRIPRQDICPKHRGQRAGRCGLCRAEAHGTRKEVTADA
ncbi:hypothetical protein GA0070563_112156 [Micromonospora carbonacea]|uniref:Uncharacterized protein n=2 Tax=Micromonospora carbonacea TaxID=47853 RepID=A0A1C5ACY1_9ACTN|nr:hypothetical protein GA0070563_112156 [Micromonospora carbonacea]